MRGVGFALRVAGCESEVSEIRLFRGWWCENRGEKGCELRGLDRFVGGGVKTAETDVGEQGSEWICPISDLCTAKITAESRGSKQVSESYSHYGK